MWGEKVLATEWTVFLDCDRKAGCPCEASGARGPSAGKSQAERVGLGH